MNLSCGVVAAFLAMPAHAAIYKCREGDHLVFRDTPCLTAAPAAEEGLTPAVPAEPSAMRDESIPEAQTAEPAPALAALADDDFEAASAELTEQAADADPLGPTQPAAAPVDGVSAHLPATEALVMSAAPITLPSGKAALRLSDAFRYLDPAESRKVLVELWGNPPEAAEDVLGMIAPVGMDFAGEHSWGVVISYSDDGHVSDEDAAQIDYADLLKDMQADTEARNGALADQDYPPVTLVGWAEPPHYDQATRKIYWAKDLAFGDADAHTLNYAIRVLGREGVLELNAVAGLDQLGSIRGSMQKVVGFADFTEGNRYEDFDASTDRAAAYGLAALVAGGVAAKKGLFAALGLFLFKFWKLLLIGVAVLGSVGGKLLGKRGQGIDR